jgi:prolyl 4-hydroxylase
MLKMHRDITSTHIISAILNIEQDVEIDWPLEIDDNYYRHHHVTMRPGDMLLYEGARVRHGRPTPLEGELFCNIFVHFMPSSGNPAMGDEITV